MATSKQLASEGCNGVAARNQVRLNPCIAIAFALLALVGTPMPGNAQSTMTMYFVHTDHLGTPQVITDEDQNEVWRAEKRPFGETSVEGSIEEHFRFSGQTFDNESGLAYNWNRYYDPSTGRYITSDPIGLGGGISTYSYAVQNPVGFVDPRGLCPACLVIPGVCADGGCELLGLGVVGVWWGANNGIDSVETQAVLPGASGGSGNYCLLFPDDPICTPEDERACPTTDRQLQKKFNHAEDFGVTGNYNKANARAFDSAIQRHVRDPETLMIRGTYRGADSAIHFYNPNTKINVIRGANGNFVSGWRLSKSQVFNLFRNGNMQ